MVQAPRLRAWDRRGIDLLVWAEHGPFPVLVQCKGFQSHEIGREQISQIEASVDRFQESDVTTDMYVVLHNRDARNLELGARIEPLLERLVTTGKATRAELWSRTDLVNKFFAALEQRIVDGLHAYSSQLLERVTKLFDFGSAYVPIVPASRRRLYFRRDRPCQVGESKGPFLADIPGAINGSSGTEWTLLTGHFGFGKTTSATRAAAANTRPVLLVPAATVPAQVFTDGNTNGLCQHIVEALGLIDDSEAFSETRGAAGAVLSYLLRHKDSSFVFVLDGLDENHVFGSLQGLQRLSNQLAEFSCAVVLTTRKEHLDVLLGDFNIAFSGLGKQGGLERRVDTIELWAWSPEETQSLVNMAIGMASGDARERLRDLRTQIEQGDAARLYGDLLTHPLFLHFILEDVASDGVRSISRAPLLHGWIERKLRRDRAAWAPGSVEGRPTIDPELPMDEFIRRMIRVLENIAFSMVRASDDGTDLLESVTEDEARAFAEAEFGAGSGKLLPLLLNSVLVVHSRTEGGLRIGFALRTLQEFLTAVAFSRRAIPVASWPQGLQSFGEGNSP